MTTFCRLSRINQLNLKLNTNHQIEAYRTNLQSLVIARHLSQKPPDPIISPESTSSVVANTNDSLVFTTTTTPKWETATEVVSNIELTGAIIPFGALNIVQKIVFPYTYSVMYYLDFLSHHLPWWLAIIGTTATIRLVFFPLVVKQNIVGIKVFNLMPETQKLQVKINEARYSNNAYEQAINHTKLKLLYDEHGVSLKKRLLPILYQAPMFVSTFLLLRRLADQPVEALTTGGALWFTNLTLPDPYFVLPVLASTSTWLLMEYGLEGSSGPVATMGPIGKWFIRSMPVALFAFTYSFPAAVLLFWATNNCFTLFYALLLKNKYVKTKLGIPERLKHDPDSLPLTNQSFKSQYKRAIDYSKANRTSFDVRRLDDVAFRKAGVGPLRKTYKSPPNLGE